MRKKRIERLDKPRFCDPGMCSKCVDEGAGNFYCSEHNVMVSENWQKTDDANICIKKKRMESAQSEGKHG